MQPNHDHMFLLPILPTDTHFHCKATKETKPNQSKLQHNKAKWEKNIRRNYLLDSHSSSSFSTVVVALVLKVMVAAAAAAVVIVVIQIGETIANNRDVYAVYPFNKSNAVFDSPGPNCEPDFKYVHISV